MCFLSRSGKQRFPALYFPQMANLATAHCSDPDGHDFAEQLAA
jgi:hypothetical protein